jgi:hypothetical protein
MQPVRLGLISSVHAPVLSEGAAGGSGNSVTSIFSGAGGLGMRGPSAKLISAEGFTKTITTRAKRTEDTFFLNRHTSAVVSRQIMEHLEWHVLPNKIL